MHGGFRKFAQIDDLDCNSCIGKIIFTFVYHTGKPFPNTIAEVIWVMLYYFQFLIHHSGHYLL